MRKTKTDRIRDHIDEYRAAGNPWPATARQISQWALARGYHPHQTSEETQAAREFADAMRLLTIKDPDGVEIRRYHAVRLSEPELTEFEIFGIEQPFLWVDVTSDGKTEQGRQKVKIAFQQERQGISNDVVRCSIELESYNKHYNTGEQLVMDFDFNPDAEEARQPVEYQG